MKVKVYPPFRPYFSPYVMWGALTVSFLLDPTFKKYIISALLLGLILIKDIIMLVFSKQQFCPIVLIDENLIKIRENVNCSIFKEIYANKISIVKFYSSQSIIDIFEKGESSVKIRISGNPPKKNKEILNLFSILDIRIEQL